MKKKKTAKKVIWIIAVLLLVAAAVYFGMQRRAPDYTEEIARTQNIETFYTFTGNVEPDSAKVVYAQGRSSVKEWKFQEGDKVEEDDEVLWPKGGNRVKAPMDGTISDLYLDTDEEFVPGDPLFRVADYAHPLIRIKVDEYDVSALKKDMQVSVKVQATGAVLTGTITRIAQEATVVNDLAFYEAQIALPQDGTLAMGLTCEVIVPRESVRDATTLSMDAIQYENGKPFVYCYSRGDEIVRQTVLLGINNGSIVEIRDGVKSGETVLIPPSSGMMFPMMPMHGMK